MIYTIYFVILVYFFLGFIGFYFINRKKERKEARNSWIKFITYFFIIHILFFSITLFPVFFRIITVIIIAGGFYELFKVHREAGYYKKSFFLLSVTLFSFLSIGFYFFSSFDRQLILFSFLILSIFDSFSQIAGQLWGRRKILPKISPKKTVEGFLGGAVVAIASSYLLGKLVVVSDIETMMLATGIVAFAFLGDLAASYYKRNYNAKDFSRLIPGHGGILDRFDSLIAGAAFVAASDLLLSF
jgi:phosphatidate cytidylyltransferase